MAIFKTKVVIVGQGLAGSLLVWELWQKGISFLVLDPCDGRSSSQAAGGLFYPLAARKLKMVELVDVQIPFMIERFHAIENILQKRFLFEKPSLKLISPYSITEWKTASENNLSHIIKEIQPEINYWPLGRYLAHYPRPHG